ncbi:MAG: 2OG-Fe(II) oxygenase, partial [Trebonia sp.]
FTASGRLEVTLTRGWEQHPVPSQRDSGRSTLEDQLPALIRVLEIGKAGAEWERKEEECRADIRKERWEEVRKEAFIRVAYERNAERLRAELDSRDAAAAMRAYADEIDARAAALEAQAAQEARELATWIREHAERTDPLNGALYVAKVTSCRYEELQPHMNGWSAHGPYRHYAGRGLRQGAAPSVNGRPDGPGFITVAIDTAGGESREARGMPSAARDRLGKTLRGDAEPVSSTDLTVRMDALALDVEGFGHAKFPVTPAKARKLIALGKPARFGRGEDTVTDPEVRDTWEIPVGLVRATWDPGVLEDVLATVKEELGLPDAAELDVDLHSLLVYEPDQFFLKHQDTEKTDEMIGTLVVTLPSAYAGGELMIGKSEDWKAYRGSRDALSLVAFYADCQHEVLKLKSGYRITLTYNLMLRGDTSPRQEGDAGTVAKVAGLMREHFGTPATTSWGGFRADPPSRLVYLLDHEYTPRALKWTRMKGADARRVPLLREAAEAVGYETILGLADVRTTHDAWPAHEGYGYRRRRYYDEYEDPEDSAEYEIIDLINTEVSLTHWTGPDGGRLEETSLSVDDTEVCASTPSGDLEPYESDYEGYMGNWGNTLDRWYHRGAIIVWPRAQAFANRAETSPGWALDEIVSIASSGDAVGAREAAATLEPVWSGLDRGEIAPASRQGAPRGGHRGGRSGRRHAAETVQDPEPYGIRHRRTRASRRPLRAGLDRNTPARLVRREPTRLGPGNRAGSMGGQVTARHLRRPAGRRPRRNGAVLAGPGVGADPAGYRNGARVVITQLPGPKARRAGQAAVLAADRGLGHGSLQHADRDLSLCPAAGGRPGLHSRDRRLAGRRGSARGNGPVHRPVAQRGGVPRPGRRLRRATARPAGPTAARARRLVGHTARGRLHPRSVRSPPRIPRRTGPAHA